MTKRYLSALTVLALMPIAVEAHVHHIQNSTPSVITVSTALIGGPIKRTTIESGKTARLDVGGYLTAAMVIEGRDGQLKGVKKAVTIPDPKFGKDVVIGSGIGDFVVQIY